jgi:hypothetical protein
MRYSCTITDKYEQELVFDGVEKESAQSDYLGCDRWFIDWFYHVVLPHCIA